MKIVDPAAVVIITPTYNTAGHGNDATGAFIPDSLGFAKYWKIPKENIFRIDNRAAMPQRLIETLKIVRSCIGGMSTLAAFCHGYDGGCQLGMTTGNIEMFMDAWDSVGIPVDASVSFFACDTADDPSGKHRDDFGKFMGDGGFADVTRDSLCRRGATSCWVDGHYTTGRDTMNPFGRRFEGLGSAVGGVGGLDIVAPGDPLWPAWKAAVETDFRFKYHFMERAEIRKELGG